MASTTTVSAIRTKLVTVLEALPPTGFQQPFRHVANRRAPIDLTTKPTSAWFRRFIIATGDPQRSEYQDPTAKRRVEDWQLRILYPRKPGYGGDLGFEGVEDLIRADQAQVEDAIYTAANWRPETRRMQPGTPTIEEAEDVWVSVVPFTVEYLMTQTI